MRRYQKATTVLILLAFLVTLGPGHLQAGVPPISRRAAVQVLQSSGIIDTKPESDLRLDDPITRAEMAKILVSAINAKSEADTRKNQAAFADTTGHWANGWIAVARDRGLFKGRDDGRFHPEDRVTYAEVLTALLRLVGRSEDAARDWPWGPITSAVALGIVPTDLPITNLHDQPATRGDVFRLTATAIGRIPMSGSDETVLQHYLDRTPPSIQLTNFPRVSSTATITVSGKAVGAVTVFVKDQMVEIDSTGTFSATLTLLPGRNRISVVAVDGAGNQAETSTDITYETTDGAFTDPATIPVTAGTTFKAPAVYLRAVSGRSTLADGIEWRYDPSVLTYDSATNQFKALIPGEYSLVAKVQGQQATAKVVVAGPATQLDLTIDKPTLAAGSAPATVTIRALDAEGRFSPGTTGNLAMTVVPQGAATLDSGTVTLKNGVGTVFLAPGPTPVGAGLTVKSSGGKTTLTAPMLPISIEAPQVSGIRLEISPSNLNPNSLLPVTINAIAVDQSGAPIPVPVDTGVYLSTSDSSILGINSNPVIKAGTASSAVGGRSGEGYVGGMVGEATISGSVSGQLGGVARVIPATVTAGDGDAMHHLDARVVQKVALADGLSAGIIAVTRVDAKGQVAIADSTPIALVAANNTVLVSQLSDIGGTATFAIRSTQGGRYTLTAGVPGRPDLNAPPLEVGFLSSTKGLKAVVKTSTTSVGPADALTAYVALQGADGGAVPNPGPAIKYLLTTNTGRLTKTEVVIPTGATRSEAVTLYAPVSATGLNLVATPQGGKALPAVQITVSKPSGGTTTTPSGNNLIAIAPPPTQPTLAGDLTRVVIQARSGANPRTGASYAFDLKVKLDGKELTVLPDNLSITLGDRSVIGTTGRTMETGEAEVWVKYTGTGHLEITPVARDSSFMAYDQYGEPGYGASTKGNQAVAAAVDYKAGPLDRLLTTISPQVSSSTVSVIRTGRGSTTSISISPSDQYGNPTGDSCVATLAQSTPTSSSLLLRSGAGFLTQQSMSVSRSGDAKFTVMSMGDEDATATFQPSVVCGTDTTLVGDPITVIATSKTPFKPTIVKAAGNVSVGGYVNNKQDSMVNITLARALAAPPAVEVLVYNGVTLIGRYGPLDLTQSDEARRTIHVPVTVFGTYSRYIPLRVRLNIAGELGDPSEYSTLFFVYVPPGS